MQPRPTRARSPGTSETTNGALEHDGGDGDGAAKRSQLWASEDDLAELRQTDSDKLGAVGTSCRPNFRRKFTPTRAPEINFVTEIETHTSYKENPGTGLDCAEPPEFDWKAVFPQSDKCRKMHRCCRLSRNCGPFTES